MITSIVLLVGPYGIAYGAIVSSGTNELSDEIRGYITEHGYKLLQTKPISNAIYISCPTIPWLLYFGVWLVLKIIYPKIYKYSKKHALSAYPVVEVYRRCSVSLMAPLSRQDYFVVPEAESNLNRSSSCTNLSFALMANRSHSTNPSMSHSTHPPGVKHAVDKTVMLNSVPVKNSIPQVANGTSRQG
ncbi:hypothetical protein J6590_068751 [Homalodisca vitripennis]|nr:hypothetical protein J6590_068751 [Homalodisca vitripennis]